MRSRNTSLALLSRLAVVSLVLAFAADVALAAKVARPWRELGGTRDTLDEAKFGKWMTVLRQERESRRQRDRDCGGAAGRGCRPILWDRLLRSLRGRGAGAQLDLVNRAINQQPYRSDRAVWGRGDYWAIPEDFLARGGDCEDFAIAKYFALRELGFAAADLRVVVLRDIRARRDHAVLVAHLDGRDLVLDVVQRFVVPWSALSHYRPLYSVNETDAWFHL